MNYLTPMQAVNTALDLVAFAIMILLIVVVYLSEKRYKTRYSTLYKMLIISYAIATIADAGTWYYLPFSADSIIFEICIILDYDFIQLTIVLIHLYLIELMENRVVFSKWFSQFAIIVCAVEGILWACSKWSGLFYSIGEQGYIHSEYHIWSQIPGAVIMFVDLLTVFVYWKKVAFNERIAWLAYGILGFSAEIFDLLTSMATLYAAFAFIILVMYIELNVQNNYIIMKQRAEIAEVNAKLVTSQIKPHFIFNCLAVIRVLCKTDSDLAAETVKRFSSFLRSTLDAVDKNELITFEEEMYIVNNYLYLEKMRFQDSLKVEKLIEVEDFVIPSLTVQPIVENAIKHGIRGRVKGGTVKIHSFETKESYCVEISDDGVGFDMKKNDNDDKNHVGMKSVLARLKYVSNGTMEVHSEVGVGTTVLIIIPK